MKITKYYIKWKNDKTGETGQGKKLFVDYDEYFKFCIVQKYFNRFK